MSNPEAAPHAGSAPAEHNLDTIYETLHAYDFVSDVEFRLGLGSILGHAGQPASEEECKSEKENVFAAKAFYYSKKFGLNRPIQYKLYIDWLKRNHMLGHQQLNGTTGEAKETPMPGETDPILSTAETTAAPGGSVGIGPAETSTAEAAATVPAPTTAEPTTTGDETPYPSSFARIVELITTGQPIPGIQQIPDTVLVGQGAPSVVPPRRKPWEKDEPVNEKQEAKEHENTPAAV